MLFQARMEGEVLITDSKSLTACHNEVAALQCPVTRVGCGDKCWEVEKLSLDIVIRWLRGILSDVSGYATRLHDSFINK